MLVKLQYLPANQTAIIETQNFLYTVSRVPLQATGGPVIEPEMRDKAGEPVDFEQHREYSSMTLRDASAILWTAYIIRTEAAGEAAIRELRKLFPGDDLDIQST